jgi:hypothetical protein
MLIYLNLAPGGYFEIKSLYLITTQLGYLTKINGSIKTENQHTLHKIFWVNNHGKTPKGKSYMSLILLIKILGSHPGIMAHQRNTMQQYPSSLH